MNLTPRQQARIHANLARLEVHTAAHALAARPATVGIWTFLETCESDLIELMSNHHAPLTRTELEWGLALYLLNDPDIFSTAERLTLHLLGMPESRIGRDTFHTWQHDLRNGGVIAADGTLVAETLWATFDPGWLLALTSYLVFHVAPFRKATFATTPAIIALDGTHPITLGLVSDWGTGLWTDGAVPCPSQAILTSLTQLSPAPDIFLHLGDVYYAGLADEEAHGLLTPLAAWTKPAFTLNSNHEMYDGANGYFGTALASAPFTSQNGTSYFALTYNRIVILGLDTAFFDRSPLYMAGALTDPDQIAFLTSLDLAGKTVIVLTHHNPIDITGTITTPLFTQVTQALGKPPDLWYYGHLHNGVAYTALSAAGPTLARCIGHGALPFGKAFCLQQPDGTDIPSVGYFAQTPFPDPGPQQSQRVLNGFATVTLHPDSTVTETFFDQDGTPRWTS